MRVQLLLLPPLSDSHGRGGPVASGVSREAMSVRFRLAQPTFRHGVEVARLALNQEAGVRILLPEPRCGMV